MEAEDFFGFFPSPGSALKNRRIFFRFAGDKNFVWIRIFKYFSSGRSIGVQ